MSAIHPEWLTRQARRFMRPDADRYMRPDAHRYMREDAHRFFKPGFGPDGFVERKAGFNPEQPRDENGRWTETGREDEQADSGAIELPEILVFPDDEPGEGQALTAQNEPNDPPEIPPQRPPTQQATNSFLKAAARWIAGTVLTDPRVRAFIAAYQALSWLDTDRYYIEAYNDPPKTLAELQQGAGERKIGYQTHHVVEQTQAESEGYPRSLIDGRDNLVRISTLKHWEITGWYARENPAFGGLSPREYLRDKGWDEKRRVGLETLQEFGVLKR